MNRRDRILIGGLLILALAVSGLLFLLRKNGAWAVVRVGGTEVARYSLSQDGVYPLNGGTNILKIENGTACMTEANCPDRLCVRQGKVRYNGQTITCLPNQLTVTISGGEKNDVDLAAS